MRVTVGTMSRSRPLANLFRSLPAAVRGGLWMMSAAGAFTVMTALIRDVATVVHPIEIAFFRSLVNLILMLPFVVRTGRAAFRTDNHRIYLFRGLVGFTFLMTFFPGAAMIPVSDSQALIFTSPLFATVMAIVFLGETMHVRRIVALIVGFCGALVILRPGFQEVNTGAVLVLVAAVAYATSNTIVKFTTRSDHPDQTVFFLGLYTTPLIAIPAWYVWTTPSLEQLALMVAIGACATANQRFLSRAFASADATAVLPFDFARLPFAAAIGFIAFSELPDIWVWLGGGLIFGASVYIAYRETKAGRQRA